MEGRGDPKIWPTWGGGATRPRPWTPWRPGSPAGGLQPPPPNPAELTIIGPPRKWRTFYQPPSDTIQRGGGGGLTTCRPHLTCRCSRFAPSVPLSCLAPTRPDLVSCLDTVTIAMCRLLDPLVAACSNLHGMGGGIARTPVHDPRGVSAQYVWSTAVCL